MIYYIFFTYLWYSTDLFLKFIHSEKATKFCEISTLDLTLTTQDKCKVEISQNFVAFSEYMNFTKRVSIYCKVNKKHRRQINKCQRKPFFILYFFLTRRFAVQIKGLQAQKTSFFARKGYCASRFSLGCIHFFLTSSEV